MPTLDPTHWLLIGLLAVLAVANAWQWLRARRQDAPLMRTANSSVMNRQAAAALAAAHKPPPAPAQASSSRAPASAPSAAATRNHRHTCPPATPPRKDAPPVGDRRAARH